MQAGPPAYEPRGDGVHSPGRGKLYEAVRIMVGHDGEGRAGGHAARATADLFLARQDT